MNTWNPGRLRMMREALSREMTCKQRHKWEEGATWKRPRETAFQTEGVAGAETMN